MIEKMQEDRTSTATHNRKYQNISKTDVLGNTLNQRFTPMNNVIFMSFVDKTLKTNYIAIS